MWTSIPLPELASRPKLDDLLVARSGAKGRGLAALFAPDQLAQVEGHPHLAAASLLKNSAKHSIFGGDLDAPLLDIPAPPAPAVAALGEFLEKDTPIVPPKPDFRRAAEAAFARKTNVLDRELQSLRRVLAIVHSRTVNIATDTAKVDGRVVDISDIPPPPPPRPSDVPYDIDRMAMWLATIGGRIDERIEQLDPE
jgi:hypothetical protein